MTSEQQSRLRSVCDSLLTPPDRKPVSVWCEEHVYVPPPQTQRPGLLRFHGCEYLREILDEWSIVTNKTIALCFGSQSGKTTMLQAGVAWTIKEDSCNLLWVMPNADLARSFSETRWQPIVRNTQCLATLIPHGQDRHKFKGLEQHLGGSVLTFVGSNSPANLSSRPVRVAVLDEVDKFPSETKGEADAVDLVKQRTKGMDRVLHVLCSTPTFVDGLIWQEFIKGDQRRYYMPCPKCTKDVIFAWSQAYTILPKMGCEAYVHWDKEARRRDGSWDMEHVRRSAHAVCPHCGGKILEADKTRMVRCGQWRPTAAATASAGYRSYHLSSIYASSTQTSFGALAVAFLQAQSSLLGLQGFINGSLAEPFENQDKAGRRTELVVPTTADPIPDTVPMLTVDCQGASPKFWLVCRDWSISGHSRLRWVGWCDQWETIRAIQLALNVADNHVCIDSGYGTADVYENCLRFGKRRAAAHNRIISVGWTPSKGREKEVKWIDKQTQRPRFHFLGYAALPPATGCSLPLLEFSGDYLLDILSRLRLGPDSCGGFRWEIIDSVPDLNVDGAVTADRGVYDRHMDSKFRKLFSSGRTGKTEWLWVKRSERHPDHILDCEIMQLAFALLHKRIPYGAVDEKIKT